MSLDINELRAKRAQAVERLEALLEGAKTEDGEPRDFTEDEQSSWDGIKADIKSTDRLIDRAEELAAEKAKLARPINQQGSAEPKKPEPKGTKFARIVRALAAAKGIPMLAAQIAEDKMGDPELAKALSSGTDADGGFIVDTQYSDEIIELLRPASVVRALGATTLPMPGGNLSVPKIAGGAAAAYVGENANIAKTQPTFGMLVLSAKKLAALVPISNDLIRFSSYSADTVVRDDLVRALSQREDAAFIRDDGSGVLLTGLRYQAPAGNVITANATVNLANVTVDLGKLELALLGANVTMTRPGWIFAPRTQIYLMDLRDGNGNIAFPEVANGMLRGKPFRTTTQVPINLSTDKSEIYLVDFSDAVIADVGGIILNVSDTAAYHDGSNVISAYSQDQTVIRAIEQHDFGMRHDASVAVLTSVGWGA